MATGDQQDIVSRLRAVLAPWFPDADQSPILNALLSGIGGAMAFCYSFIQYAAAQTRLATASGGWVDLWGWDYLGAKIMRRTAELDSLLKARIIKEIFRDRCTRNGVSVMLSDLTGNTPIIFEPTLPMDTGAYNQPSSLAYCMAGGYGSLALPFQCFVTAFRPSTSGIPSVTGYGAPAGGYGIGSAEYGALWMIVGAVTDADIFAAVNDVRPAVSIPWTAITNKTTPIQLTTENGTPLTTEGGTPLLQG